MIQINLVSRIDDDKNSFMELVYAAHKLKESGITGFHILFIGAVYKPVIYQSVVQMAGLLGVDSHIGFTKKSIPMAQLPPEIKDGYFLIHSIGDFIGYSGIESIDMGLKTIICNVDKNFAADRAKYINSCEDIHAVIELIKLIDQDKEAIDRQIIANNIEIKKAYYLSDQDKNKLLSLLLPVNNGSH